MDLRLLCRYRRSRLIVLIPAMAVPPLVRLLAGLAISVVAAFGDQLGVPEAMMKIVDGNRGKSITRTDLGTRPTIVSNFQIDQHAADGYRHGISAYCLLPRHDPKLDRLSAYSEGPADLPGPPQEPPQSRQHLVGNRIRWQGNRRRPRPEQLFRHGTKLRSAIDRKRTERRRCARLVLVTGLCRATVRSAKLGVRTGWNAAAACHQAGLAGTFAPWRTQLRWSPAPARALARRSRQLAAAGFGLYTSRGGFLAWKGAVR
jgi:hypothetical protein